LEPGIVAPDCLLFPTVTASDSGNSRPAGVTKLDQWWKEQGLIPDGWQLSAEAMAAIQGYPSNWFEALNVPHHLLKLPSPIAQGADSQPDSLQVAPSPQPKPRSLLSESNISGQLSISLNKKLTGQSKKNRSTERSRQSPSGSLYL
jgi:hypothetical protein